MVPIMQGVGTPWDLILDANENLKAKVKQAKCLSYELKILCSMQIIL
jgi:hypothetical protein